MYIETRYFDNGKAQAKLHKGFSYPNVELLEIELDDIVQLVIDLDSGNWVDITNYI